MSEVLVLLMVVVLLAFALGVVVLVAILLRRESDKVRAARGESDPSVEREPSIEPEPSVEQRPSTGSGTAARASGETTGDAETEDTQAVPTSGLDAARLSDTP